MKGKGTARRWIASILVIVLMISSIQLQAQTRAQASTAKDISSTYLNATVKYLYLEKQRVFNFNIKKVAQKKGATYNWYIKSDQGNPEAITINKKTGVVTAKEVGIAYIGCKITLADKKVVTPEAKVIVKSKGTTKGSVSVSTQSQLDKALNEKNVTEITLATETGKAFTISAGDYSTKNLIVNAPNADVINYGSFKNITVKAIKDSTWIEYADGNVIYLSDKQLRIVVESGAHIKRIVFDTADTIANVEINGIVDEVIILQPVAVSMSGTAGSVPVVVEETAGGSTINSSMALNVQLNANADITLSKGAEASVFDKSNSKLDVNVDNQTSKEIILTTNHMNGAAIKAGENTIPSALPSVTPTAAPVGTTGIPSATTTPDNVAPVFDASNGAVLGTDFQSITLTFSEKILNNLGSLAALKNNIAITYDNGTTTIALGTGDNVEISNNQLRITLGEVMAKENARIVISANTLKDTTGNVVSSVITSNVLTTRNNTLDKATLLNPDGGEIKAYIEAEGDIDCYSFHAQAGKAYYINIYAYSMVGLQAGIVDKKGDSYGSKVANGYSSSIPHYELTFLFVAPTSDTYYIPIAYSNYMDGLSTIPGCYGIEVSTSTTEVQAGEPDNGRDTATLLTAADAALTRCIYPLDDVDWYQFTAEAMKTYTIKVTKEDNCLEPEIFLMNSAGEQLVHKSDTYEADTTIDFNYSVTEAGTYYVTVGSKWQDMGFYKVELTSEETKVDDIVTTAEEVAEEEPQYAKSYYDTALRVVTAMTASAAKTAFETRLDAVYAKIEVALLPLVNSATSSNELLDNLSSLGWVSVDDFSYKTLEIVDLYLKEYPVRNYTSLSNAKASFDSVASRYYSILNGINSATDITSMRLALNELATLYPLRVTDTLAQKLLDNHINYELISDFTLNNLCKVKYGATLRTVSGSAIITTTKNEAVSASVSGTSISSGTYVETGSDVVITIAYDSGYHVVNIPPSAVGSYQVSFTNLQMDANVQAIIVKTPTIKIPTTTFKYPPHTVFTEDLLVPIHMEDTILQYARNENTNEQCLETGACRLEGNNLVITKELLNRMSEVNKENNLIDLSFINSEFFYSINIYIK